MSSGPVRNGSEVKKGQNAGLKAVEGQATSPNRAPCATVSVSHNATHRSATEPGRLAIVVVLSQSAWV